MARPKQKANKSEGVRVSDRERDILQELIKSEKANLRVFSLPSKKEQAVYERILEGLDRKFL